MEYYIYYGIENYTFRRKISDFGVDFSYLHFSYLQSFFQRHFQSCLSYRPLTSNACKLYYLIGNRVCNIFITPQTLFVGGILFSRCPSVRPSVHPCVRPSVRPSVTLCFLNNSKSHCRIFIKPCKHVHICKTNTLDKKVRARGQFY